MAVTKEAEDDFSLHKLKLLCVIGNCITLWKARLSIGCVWLRNVLEIHILLSKMVWVNPTICLILSGKLIKNLQIKLLRILSGQLESNKQSTKAVWMKTSTKIWMNVFILRCLSVLWIARENSRDLDNVMKVHTQNIGCASVTYVCCLFSNHISPREGHPGHNVFWLQFVQATVTMEISLTEICS